MLEFARWKYFVIVFVLVFCTIYAMPNLYPQDPSVQVSAASGAAVDATLKGKVDAALAAAHISPKAEETDAKGKLLLRMRSADEQTKANDAVKPVLGEGETTALNLLPTVPKWLSSLGAKPMSLGLDLQGGVHFLMQVDEKAALEKKLEGAADSVRALLRDKSVTFGSVDRMPDETVVATLSTPADALNAQKVIDAGLRANAAGGPNPYSTEVRNNQVVVRLSALDSAKVATDAIDQNRAVIADRISGLGVAEPVLQRQGNDRLVVELPGLQDTAEAKRQIGATATLEFRAVTGDELTAAEAQRSGNIPPDSKLYHFEDGRPILLSKRVLVSGDELLNAQAIPDQKTGLPSVSVTLNAAAGKRMFDHTVNNVHKRLATVYIDRIPTVTKDANGNEVRGAARVQERVIAAPDINEPFGANFLTTGLSQQQATDLVRQLKSGALAAPMDFVEEYVIGPSLGAENVQRGIKAVVFSFLFTLGFFAIYYRMFGLITSVALLFNLLIVVAVMSLFGATMTLPGFAGLALSVGLSVDANVLINERIREELRHGMPAKAAIAAGYEKASHTIFDANLTGLIVGVALYAFGSGPLKGFALTMIIGIFASMFTAITVSRALATLIYGRRKHLKSIAI
ncbi:protein translocase subunit SecD [Solilutibacter silvestris]|uniref:Protein translocase subunit SecD n=1 Tax=Solilutibacter silvestris TaxID=1645665 RepID=A0A2K1PY07_9GAMM|nr:protein translocase subunit SecD [Lysobacter silvestris]PNS07668.1 secD: protein-export membrane protein SecD [Lysobacter silvestris]